MKKNTTKSGVIVNCLWTSLHEKPRNDSEVVCDLLALSEVLVFPEQSVGDFYLVHLPSGDEGYCLKDHVAVRR